jgi:Domain of unknown function (DUF6438)
MTKLELSVFNLYLRFVINKSFIINQLLEMKNIVLVFSTVLLVVACSKKTAQIVTQPSAPIAVESPINTPIKPTKTTTKAMGIPKDVDPNLVASLHRSPCFGKCPAFSYELFSDGKVTYLGQSNVTRMGSYTTKVDDAFMKRITDKALSIKYLSLSDHYPTADIAVSDVPTVTTYIRVGNDGKKITNNYDPPKELTEFEQWLEAQFEALKWQQAKE